MSVTASATCIVWRQYTVALVEEEAMGNFFGSIFGKKRYRILMLGLGTIDYQQGHERFLWPGSLDNAGKTSIVQRLRQQELVPTIPTVGFVVENVMLEHVQFTIWDVGGQVRIKWEHLHPLSPSIIRLGQDSAIVASLLRWISRTGLCGGFEWSRPCPRSCSGIRSHPTWSWNAKRLFASLL